MKIFPEGKRLEFKNPVKLLVCSSMVEHMLNYKALGKPSPALG
jgi:hypothetical protein